MPSQLSFSFEFLCFGDSFYTGKLSAALFTRFASSDILSNTADRDQGNTIRIFSLFSVILHVVMIWLLGLLHSVQPMKMTLRKLKTRLDFKLSNTQCFQMGSWWWSWVECLTTTGITIAHCFLNLYLPWETTCCEIFALSHSDLMALGKILTI